MSVREFERMLIDNGYEPKRWKGDHRIWYKGENHISVPIKKLNPMFMRRLIKTYDLKAC